ncbi:MAG: low molecular weight protein-tyrosine-phosphatase [Phycisphaerales bacterium]
MSGSPHRTRAILFVCLGNICRSPLAKAVFAQQARARGVIDRFEIDSCGTGSWHAGGPADPRTLAVAKRFGIPMVHTARQFDPGADAGRFELILAMDRDNAAALRSMGAPRERVRLFRSFDPELRGEDGAAIDVPDPYLGGPEGFEHMYHLISRASAGLLDHLQEPAK